MNDLKPRCRGGYRALLCRPLGLRLEASVRDLNAACKGRHSEGTQ